MQERPVVIITGSSGYIGSALAKKLSESFQVVGIDYKPPRQEMKGVAHYELDITSDSEVRKTLLKIKSDFGSHLVSVIHLIAFYSFAGEEDERYNTITYGGTHSLIRHLNDNFSVEQFLFSSSMLVYRPVGEGEKITEDSPLEPKWPYPKSKVKVEHMLREQHGKIPVLNLRIAGVYDETCHQPTLAHQILRIHEGWATSIPFPGNPDHGQAMLHLDDLVCAVSLLIRKRKSFPEFETFVLAEEEVLSFRELQKEIGTLDRSRPWPVIQVPKWVASSGAAVMEKLPFMREPFIKPWMIPHADEHFDMDISRIKKALQWSPQHSLKETLPLMIKNLKQDPERWYEINKMEKPFYRDLSLINSDRERTQWLALAFVFFAGLWMIGTAFTYPHQDNLGFINELASGIAVSLIGLLTLIPTLSWLRWINAFIGVWIMFSPLLLSGNNPAAYVNGTLAGTLILLASVYTPSPIRDQEKFGIPRGWTYNPSTAGQRLPIMFLGYLGFLFSRYLASYQLGHIPEVWDPFFGDGTAKVLESSVSKAFPVSDAGLGAFTYLLDVIAAAIGGKYRWKTMPWIVILFGFMIIPAGATSIVLIMLQPISVGAWCTICLITAFIMLLMVPPAVDEVLASGQFLYRSKKEGKSFWKVFWMGSHEMEESKYRLPEKESQGSLWHLVACTLIGIWMMCAPAVLNQTGIAANNIYIISALIITFSIIAFSEVSRLARLLNVPLALWLIGSAWFLGTMDDIGQWNSTVAGIFLIVLSLPFGKTEDRFGAVDKIVHWSPLRR